MNHFRIFVFVLAATLLSNCTKRNEFNDETAQSAVDLHNCSSALDEIMIDVNKVVTDQYLMRGKTSGGMASGVCGMLVDTSRVYSGICYLNYVGEECRNQKRSGSIKVIILNYPTAKWKQKGCVIRLEVTNFMVTHLADGKSYQFNGTINLTNESGGTWYEMFYLHQPTVIYKYISEVMHVKFDGVNVSAGYNVARRMSFSANANKVVFCSVEGCGTLDGKTVDSWGQTREGGSVYSQVTTPVDWRTDCSPSAPIAGATLIQRNDRDYKFTTKFGTDNEGNSSLAPLGECPYGYRVEWSYSGNTNKRVFEFYH